MKVAIGFSPQDEREMGLMKLLQTARPDIKTVGNSDEFLFEGTLSDAEKIVHAVAKLDATSTRIKRCYEATQVKPFTESNRER